LSALASARRRPHASASPLRRRLSAIRDRVGRPAWLRDRRLAGLVVSLLVLLALFAASLAFLQADRPGRALTLDQLSTLAERERIATAELRDHDAVVAGTLREPGAPAFSVSYPASDAVTATLVERLTRAGARVSVDAQPAKQAVQAVSTFLLPLVILANLFALLFVAGRGGGAGVAEIESFGTMGDRGRTAAGTGVTFADVAGAGEAVGELREVVDYLRDPDRYAAVGAVPPKGVLLFGPPGTGKTLLARAVAGEAGVPFFSVAGAEFVESLVGVGAARVRDLFAQVRAAAPAIVFIDELDAAGRRRGGGDSGGGADEREQTLNQLLVEMDGFAVSAGIVVMGATNRPDILDPALLRPGRFDRHVTIDAPDAEGRRTILELHARGKPVAPGVDFGRLARRTPGFTGADLANVVNEAALLAVRGGHAQVGSAELDEAVQRVLHGPQRRGRVLSEAERRRAAVHEAGHAVVAAAQGRAEDVHRVSILARGRGLGLTSVRRETDAVLITRAELEGQIAAAMAGLAAEELMLGSASTGAEQDLEQATDLAREIAGRYGLSERLGRARLLARDADAYLGGTTTLAPMAARTHEAFDAEVANLLDAGERSARALLDVHRDVLERLTQRLLDDETLEGAALAELLAPVADVNVR
jgi:cell division protease FtsH